MVQDRGHRDTPASCWGKLIPGCMGTEAALGCACSGTAFGRLWLADAASCACMFACCGSAPDAPCMYSGAVCQAGRGAAIGTPPEEGTTLRLPATA